jgi:two-component system chemotaxis sensor kinase CheA
VSWWSRFKPTKPRLTIAGLLSSLEEGYVVFDQEGFCLPIQSKAAANYLGFDPSRKHIIEILGIEKKREAEFMEWYSFFFNPELIFSDVADLGPQNITVDDRHIAIKWRPFFGDDEQVIGVIMIALDDTERSAAEERVRKLKDYADLVVKFTNDKNMFINFFQFVSEEVKKVQAKDRNVKKGDVLRLFHTVKGGAASLSMIPIRDLCHQIEHELSEFIETGPSRAEMLEEFSRQATELDRAIRAFQRENRKVFGGVNWSLGTTREVSTEKLLQFAREFQNQISGDLLERFIEEVVSVPVEQLFEQARGVIAANSQRFAKLVYFEVESDDVRMIPENYTSFLSSLIHLFNNMVDHGIEIPAVRKRASKHETGMIRVKVDEGNDGERFGLDTSVTSQFIRFEISDDGRGIDPELIRKRMLDNLGLDTSNESDEEVIYHVFDHGFSTKKSVSHVSGRGVGLDAVRESILELGGKIAMQSEVGQGTTFEIVLPHFKRVDIGAKDILQEASQQWVDRSTRIDSKKAS